VFDSLGGAQDLNFEFRKTIAPTANATSTTTNLELADDFIAETGASDTDQFSIAVGGGAPTTITISTGDTVKDVLDAINTIAGVEARLNSAGQMLIQASELSQDVVIADVTGTPATDIGIVGTASAPTPPNIYPAGAGSLENSPNTQGWWEVRVLDTDGSVLSSGHANFNGDGSLNASPDIDGEIKISLTDIDWGNGSELQDIDIQIDRFSQFAGGYNVLFLDQNGAELGLRTGVEINEDGVVFARFSNGQSSALYQIPLATFTNPNGLEEVSGVAFRETSSSGSFNLREAKEGGAGVINAGSPENSNVDLAEEFSKLIITQRAYSAGTKIISTVDEITEELLRLR